jgi:hypothetical protein
VADFSHRTDAIRWDSPTIAGFVLSAAIGEAATVDRSTPVPGDIANFTSGNGPIGTYWATALRYAGEFSGFRVAAAAAYESSEAEERMASASGLGQISGTNTNLGFSASILHVGSGLFLQGSHITFRRANLDNAKPTPLSPNTAQDGGYDTGTLWHVQGGIAKNWTGLGNTALYGEYAQGRNLQRTFSPVTDQIAAGDIVFFTDTKGDNIVSPAAIQAVNGSNVYTMWGLGVVQNIDAAAMELYLAFRNHSLNRNGESTGANAGVAVNDIQTVMGGVRIAF